MTRTWRGVMSRLNLLACVAAIVVLMTSCGGPAPSPSPRVGQVMVIDEDGHRSVLLTVVDDGDHLEGVRGATIDEIKGRNSLLANTQIAALALDGQGRREVLVIWAGFACDKTATLTVDPQANRVTIAPDPISGCELAPVNRAVVLSFRNARDLASMRLDLRSTPIVEDPS